MPIVAGRPSGTPLVAAVMVAVLLAACSASAAPAATTAAASPAPTSAPTATPPLTAAPTASPMPKPSPAPVDFVSVAYQYRVTFPGTWTTTQAQTPWDGTSQIDSNGPYTDQVVVPGSILFFVYGAPTKLQLDAYTVKTQAEMVAWHDCPAVPDSATDLALGGTPGRLHRMTCLGVDVQKLMVVRDGQGLVLNMLAPPESKDEASKLLEQIVAAFKWPV